MSPPSTSAPRIALVDYGAGNLRSVSRALARSGLAPMVTSDPQAVREADGVVRLLGRMDDLVIRGGVKISPGEIEDALLAHPGVAEAAAVGVPDAIYGQEVVAFVVPREGAVLDSAGLQAHAAGLLPRAKRPLAVCVIDTLPRNARGKLRPDALQALWREMLG